MITSRALRDRHLCACLAAALGLVAGRSHAAVTVAIDDCGDADTVGSLRNTIAAAANNAVIDVSACSTITLLQGELFLTKSVTIQGKANGTTTIDANYLGRALHGFASAPYNSLTLSSITLTHGRDLSPAYAHGGCIEMPYVTLLDSVATDCIAKSDYAKGGAIKGEKVTLQNSRVENSSAQGTTGYQRGGGIYSHSDFTCTSSSITGNETTGTNFSANGGGVSTFGSVAMASCTIASNSSSGTSAGLFNYVFSAGHTFEISNSTVSGNTAHRFAAMSTNQNLTMKNSTVVNNSAPLCGGVYVQGNIQLVSSIAAQNTREDPYCGDLVATGSIAGEFNLVSLVQTPVPVDTIVANPLLTPLAYRGGPTPTHGLSIGSPAIDAGSNADLLATDQRGPGFAREVGAHADIGAFERQADDDQLFYGGFD